MADKPTLTDLPPFAHRITCEELRGLLDAARLEERLYSHRLILVRGGEPSDELLA